VLTQSLAIIEYLEETRPEPPLLPGDAAGRARVRAIALSIACEIHPLNNLRVLGYLNKTLGVAEEQRNAWYRHWVETGLATVEAMLAGDPRTGSFCHGNAPTLADVLLVPQIFNAQRFDCRLDHVPTVMRIHRALPDAARLCGIRSGAAAGRRVGAQPVFRRPAKTLRSLAALGATTAMQ
jgi:maleylacetoacetate isomerase